MKAKLIKNVVGEYHLIVDKCPAFISISEPVTNGFVIASLSHEETDFLKLSIKNCQAIERGYDLDKLARENTSDIRAYSNYIKGFQKALEILGDRKFTEEDMRRALSAGLSIGYGRQFEIENKKIEIDSYIQSLQQNEWEVEVEMEGPLTTKSRHIHGEFVTGKILENAVFPKPKLDADGRLILKRAV